MNLEDKTPNRYVTLGDIAPLFRNVEYVHQVLLQLSIMILKEKRSSEDDVSALADRIQVMLKDFNELSIEFKARVDELTIKDDK